jgi:hypothetical protein
VLNVGFTYAYKNLIFPQTQQMHECARTSEYPDCSKKRCYENRVSIHNLSLYYLIPSVQKSDKLTQTNFQANRRHSVRVMNFLKVLHTLY